TVVARAFTLHDSDRWHVSLEFSLAAIFPSRTCNLRGGGAAAQAGVSDPGYSGTWGRRGGEGGARVLKPGSATRATAALGLVALTSVAGLTFHTTGSYAFPLTWIFVGS